MGENNGLIICIITIIFVFFLIGFFGMAQNPNDMIGRNENFLDWSMYNPPIVNGYTPNWWKKPEILNSPRSYNHLMSNHPMSEIMEKYSPQYPLEPNINTVYNPLGYYNRNKAFYDQGWYPNMNMPPQVIGCGGRKKPCLGGTEEIIPTVFPPVEISERNIAPVNIIARSPNYEDVGVLKQVGVLYKIFGSLNEIFPLYGVRRYKNSDTWDYSTKVGKEGNFVHLKVLTKRLNNNELQTNDVVKIDGNSAKFRVTIYDKDFPQYVPYFKN